MIHIPSGKKRAREEDESSLTLHKETLPLSYKELDTVLDASDTMSNNDFLKYIIEGLNDINIIKTALLKCYETYYNDEFPDAEKDATYGSGSYHIIQDMGKSNVDNKDYVLSIMYCGFIDRKQNINEVISEVTTKLNRENDIIEIHRELAKNIDIKGSITSIAIPMHNKRPGWVCELSSNDNNVSFYFVFIVMRKGTMDFEQFIDTYKRNDEVIKKAYIKLYHKINAMHELGFVHGDIKPDNIIWIDDEPFLIDFDFVNRLGSPNMYKDYIIYFNNAFNIDFSASRKPKYYINPDTYERDAKENLFRVDYWIFQFLANFITKDSVYNELTLKFAYPTSEIEDISKKDTFKHRKITWITNGIMSWQYNFRSFKSYPLIV